MQNLLEELKKLLKKDERFVVDGKLLKNKIIELGLKLDPILLKLLISNKDIKTHFFQEIDGILIFDKIKFQKFVSNKSFLPDSYTSFKNKIGLVADEEFIIENKDVVLNWPYKDCILEGGQQQEEEKKNEIFWNEILAPNEIDRLLTPKVFCNFLRYDKKGSSQPKEITSSDNFIFKGNNLLVLHSLRKTYRNKVDLIYIDPPYNTGNDGFNYNDYFNHSTWLTFIKNRLEIAKELLAPTGSIFIQIDYNEFSYLKVLCDEVFGKSNFRNCIVWKKLSAAKAQSAFLSNVVEFILFYSKSDQVKFIPKYLQSDEDLDLKNYAYVDAVTNERYGSFDFTQAGQGEGRYFGDLFLEPPTGKHWIWSQEKINDGMEKGLIMFTKTGMPRLKRYLKNKKGNYLSDLWNDEEVAPLSANDKERLSFNGQKRESLIRRIIELTTEKGDLVLDFFLGTGTTAATAHKLERQYIGIEQLDYIKTLTLKRMKSVIKGDDLKISREIGWNGGGSLVYAELKEVNQIYIDKINSISSKSKLINVFTEILNEAQIDIRISSMDKDQLVNNFETLSLAELKTFLIEIIDKNLLYLPYSEMEDKSYKISDIDKALNKKFYSLKI